MRLHLPLLLFLVNTAPSDAGLISRGTESVARTANRLHRKAAKRSAGLAQDLRRAFSGMYSKELAATTGGSQRAYCVGNSNGATLGGNANNTSPSGDDEGNDGSRPSPTPDSPWQLKKNYQGDTFFDGWDFFTAGDPTHGLVDYVDRNTAQSAGLIDVNSAGRILMRVDTTQQVSGNRRSVRITTKDSYTGGLILLDAVHMPTGCATWPAFWSNGPNWPNGGEIDILEGVHDNANNQATLHTSRGCTVPSSASSSFTGSLGESNCAALDTGNAGCGIGAKQPNTYGVGFNNQGGGVYAMQWVDSGISVWFFSRDDVPSDITAGAPLPDSWGKPMAFFPASHCDPFKFFNSHNAIFDTTLCGDWAGATWGVSGPAGQEQSCQARTGVATCEEFVRTRGDAFKNAYWEVNYVKVFQL
ncbi:concanavalin A-like lectin/glucanase domain-containing protein [Earliella scabrosa]|nr:concanavalin A-like lectin/glucanase domain-containing protein [Earliella scabrosa]